MSGLHYLPEGKTSAHRFPQRLTGFVRHRTYDVPDKVVSQRLPRNLGWKSDHSSLAAVCYQQAAR